MDGWIRKGGATRASVWAKCPPLSESEKRNKTEKDRIKNKKNTNRRVVD
jgi:hypothetical protein